MPEETSPQPKRLSMSLDPRVIIGVLLLVIIAMLALWRPWQGSGISDRSIDVTGEAKVTAEPDEFRFYPSYQYQNKDKAAALEEATKKHNEIIAKLKELGVPDNKIKSDTSGFDSDLYRPGSPEGKITYSSTLTISVSSRDQAQKVQDYLLTTAPQGSISPTPSFSDEKRKQLESQARDEATKDARAKADQSAKNLGFKVGKVKTVSDGAGFNEGGYPIDGAMRTMQLDVSNGASLQVQPGENELRYSVSVTYYLN